ncbi:MAG: VTT domain-containing protein [Ignavibacteriales bacterium]|nr:VTT domain-containing protein [Ignavibacteriales bacterium]
MDFLGQIWEIVNHLDNYLSLLTTEYGNVTYLFLFILILLETNFVLTPILPGVTVLFAAGTIAAYGQLDPFALFTLFTAAVFIGDMINYAIGKRLGDRAYQMNNRFIKPSYIKATEDFFHKHGSTTMFLARYFPIVRTFAPFVAGIVKMKFSTFFLSSLLSAMMYILLYVGAGYFFGHIPFVKNNLTLTLFIVAFASVIPAGYKGIHKYIKHRHITKKG